MSRIVSRIMPAAAIGCISLAHVAATGGEGADERLVRAAGEPQNWLTHGGTYDELRYSALDAVDSRTMGTLGLAWSLELDTRRGQETTPLAVDGTVYVTTAWSMVVAMDGATGRQHWSDDPHVPATSAVRGCCDVVNRGAAFYHGGQPVDRGRGSGQGVRGVPITTAPRTR